MNQIIISPSILASDFASTGEALVTVEKSGAKWLHLDVMDGSFVPNISFGPKMISDLRKRSSLFFDTHLMIEKPERYIEDFAKAGSDAITFHYEATKHSHSVVQAIKKAGKKAGISIVPSTPVSVIEEIIKFVDIVLIMTVNPGFGGQTLIPECLDKAKKLRQLKKDNNLNFIISVDGGINKDTAKDAINSGCQSLVMGSAFFTNSSPKELVSSLEKL